MKKFTKAETAFLSRETDKVRGLIAQWAEKEGLSIESDERLVPWMHQTVLSGEGHGKIAITIHHYRGPCRLKIRATSIFGKVTHRVAKMTGSTAPRVEKFLGRIQQGIGTVHKFYQELGEAGVRLTVSE